MSPGLPRQIDLQLKIEQAGCKVDVFGEGVLRKLCVPLDSVLGVGQH